MQTRLTDRERRRNRLFTTSGVVIEWYDFMVYGLLATTLQQVFYPTGNATTGLILTFVTFAVGYLARPIGGIVIGRLGDTRGRRFALVLSTTLMLIPLFITTILPTYDQIGIWAPILLTVMRLMQGFSVGGEYSGALTALSESAAQSGRGRSVSLGLATAAITVNLAISAAPRPFLVSPISAAPPKPRTITGRLMASSPHWSGAFSGFPSSGDSWAVAVAVVTAGTLTDGF